MALRNATTDLTIEELAALRAADDAGYAAAIAGTATIHASETTTVPALVRALRGRGLARPINLLLGEYYKLATGSQMFNRPAALACAATPGVLDESRAIENT